MEALEVSDKIASYPKKPLIAKGYYEGKLLKVEMKADKEGKLIEDKFGHQVILTFQVFKDGKAVEYQDGEETREVLIASFAYADSKQPDGTFRTAVTQNAKITKTFIALGWEFNAAEKLDMESFIGKSAEINVNDFTKLDQKFSVIETIAALPDQYPKETPVNLE
jgi:hypothetical protein